MPEEFENIGFARHHFFTDHTTQKNFENSTITGHFRFVFQENSVKKVMFMSFKVTPYFSKKLRFQTVLRPHENKKPAFSNSSGLKDVFEKHRFRDGLVWTEGATVEIKLCLRAKTTRRPPV